MSTTSTYDKTQYAERRDAGLCPYGNDHDPPLHGRKACAACLKRHRYAMQRYMLRQKRLKADQGKKRSRSTPTPGERTSM